MDPSVDTGGPSVGIEGYSLDIGGSYVVVGGPFLGYMRSLSRYRRPFCGHTGPLYQVENASFLVMRGICRYRRFHYKYMRPL